ncbi:MAG TPA: amidohydrolase family protein [Chthoniobacterales bacterium]|nr:amidohydrolase family protein [Chthoniobacterales bacterium]
MDDTSPASVRSISAKRRWIIKSRRRHASALLAIAATFAAWGSPHFVQAQDPAGAPQRPIIAIEGVAVVDVARGEIASPRTVLVGDGQITAIGEPATIDIPPAAVRVDGRGRFLMPGLVDMHVHLFNNASRRAPNEWTFPLFVANGVTGVREMLTEPAAMTVVDRWRTKMARGELVAPRVLAAGASVSAESEEATRRQVREAKTAGVDFLKIFSQTREPQWRAILDEAGALKIPVCGHIPAEVGLLDAANAGQRSNEHLTQIYEACSAREKQFLDARKGLDGREIVKLRDAQEPEVLESFDQPICDRAAAALAKTDQVQVPTLVLSHFEARGSPAKFRDDPRWRCLRSDEQARWERILKDYPPGGKKLSARRWEISRRIVKTLHAAGVRILAGTDAPMPLVYPGYALHKELELLVEAGLSPADALRSATIWPAEFLGLSDSSGSIAVGKRADLLLLDANPLSDISHTQRIRAVVLKGRLLQRADLDALSDAAITSEAKQPVNPYPSRRGAVPSCYEDRDFDNFL